MAPPRSSLSFLSVAGGPAASGESSAQESEARKRVTKACDRCRLKKIKCDGQLPCSRCSVENSICRYGERKATTERRIPPGYVEYLEEQQQLLVKALKKCWVEVAPSPVASGEDPPIHTILENLGVFSDFPLRQQRTSSFHFEEDLEVLREKCEAEGAAVSSASTATSHPVSAEPTPSRLSPEADATAGFPVQQSRSQTWSPANPFQQTPSQAMAQSQQSSPAFTAAPQLFLPQNASAPPSLYASPATEMYQSSQWQQSSLAQVHSDPSHRVPMEYWQQHPQQSQHWHAHQPPGEQQYSTVDPAALMLPSTDDAYLRTAETWPEDVNKHQRRQW